MNRKLVIMIGLLAVFLLVAGQALAEDVDVYAEGAYTDSDLAVYIYADINTTDILSFGVKLNYDNSKLEVASAQKNEDIWYMGDGSTNYSYVDPDVSTPGEVVILGGKLDTSAPTAGVAAGQQRVLLGTVTFNRLDSATPTSPQEAYFGISLTLGKASPYVNFASTAGDSLDSNVGFSAIVRERGDANADGMITGADRSAVRYFLVHGGDQHPWMDCNADGIITGADRSCIKYLLTH